MSLNKSQIWTPIFWHLRFLLVSPKYNSVSVTRCEFLASWYKMKELNTNMVFNVWGISNSIVYSSLNSVKVSQILVFFPVVFTVVFQWMRSQGIFLTRDNFCPIFIYSGRGSRQAGLTWGCLNHRFSIAF